MIRQNTQDFLKSTIFLSLSDVYFGSGIYCDDKGNIYDGEFVYFIFKQINGAFEGMGHFKSKEGESYVGLMKKNRYHGKVF